MLIAGRSLQSAGAGGTNMLIELIICDFVPLRERSKFLGIILGTSTVGIATGPFLGGVIAQSTGW
jgi:MFS family permease